MVRAKLSPPTPIKPESYFVRRAALGLKVDAWFVRLLGLLVNLTIEVNAPQDFLAVLVYVGSPSEKTCAGGAHAALGTYSWGLCLASGSPRTARSRKAGGS
jgi:hypothetical protein